MQKISWFTIVNVILAIIAIFVGMPNLGAISHNARIFVQFPILLVMVVAAISSYVLQLKDAVPERRTWFWLMIATFFTFLGDSLFIYGNIITSMTIITISSVLMFLAYACFIIGLIAMSNHIRTNENKNTFWIPAIVALIGFAIAGFFLMQSFQASNLDNVLKVTFIVYLVADFFLIVANLLVVMRTMGGKLSLPYFIIAIGCTMLVAYQLSSLFMMAGGIDIYTSRIQLVFVAALAILTAGVDMRFCIQKEMSRLNSK